MGPLFRQQMDEIAAYRNSKFLSSIEIVFPLPLKKSERGKILTLNSGNRRVNTCYTAAFLSAACYSDIIVINI
jgi:hypothetical protein